MSGRAERHLGWVTLNQQRFAPVRAAVVAGMCPVCGEGPFVVPANHAAKKHGIDRFAFREMIGATQRESICDSTHSAACRERGKRSTKEHPGRLVRRGSAVGARRPAAVARATANLRAWEASQSEEALRVQRVAASRRAAEVQWGYDPNRDRRVVEAYDAGTLPPALQKQFGLSEGNVLAILKRAGRSPGVDLDNRRDERARRLLAAYDAGASTVELARSEAISPRSVRKILARARRLPT